MLRALRRRGWVVALTVVVAALFAYVVASTRAPKYTAEGVAVVAAGARLTPDQANGLAITDAVLIPKDDTIAAYVARSLGTTVKQVRDRLGIFNDATTAILRIRYTGRSAAAAREGATAALHAIAGPHPVSRNIAPSSIQVVRFPATPTGVKGVSTLVVIGLIVGLALGFLLLAAWERTDPRIDDVDELAAAAAAPTTSFDSLSESGAAALLERWRKLAGRETMSVAFVPATARLEQNLEDLVALLAFSDESTIVSTRPPTHSDSPRGDETSFVVGGVPGGAQAGEGVALQSDLTVLVVEHGTRRADLTQALEALHRFGIHPDWTMLVSKRFIDAVIARPRPGVERSPVPSVGSTTWR
jgi:capsular polysaccharide biosynthesis protein